MSSSTIAPTVNRGKKGASRVLLVLAGILGSLFLMFTSLAGAGEKDTVCYWAASRLLMNHQNPYDFDAVLELERAQGGGKSEVFLVRNVPVFLTLTIPLGYLSFPAAAAAWFLFLFGCFLVSMYLLRPVGETERHRFAYGFMPVYCCLTAGQTGLILLLGLALFYRYHDDSRAKAQLAAGAGLAALVFKPHLFLVFGIPLCAWIILKRRTQILAGAMAMLALLELPLLRHPGVWGQYFEMLRASRIGNDFIPTLPNVIHRATGIPGIQFVPLVLGLIWVGWYFYRNRHAWSWQYQGLLVLLISVAVAPYEWINDEVILLPAISWALVRCQEKVGMWFITLNTVILVMAMSAVRSTSGYYCWTPLAWLLWFEWTRRSAPVEASRQP